MSAFANLKWAYGKCIEEINKRPSTDMTAPSGYIILDNGKKAQVQVTVTTNVDDFIPSPDDEESFNNHLQKQILEQQPIPQDINEAEVEKYARLRGWEVAQALLPELQQLREENESLIKQQKIIVDANAKLDKQIEQQKSQIEGLSWDINKLAIENKEQAAEIELLKQENHKNEIYKTQKDYWKQRCEAAEAVMKVLNIPENLGNYGDNRQFLLFRERNQHWQTLKQQTHG